MLRGLWAIGLAILLTACGTIGQPPGKDLVEQAIVIQLNQVQAQLSQQLRLDNPIPDIKMNRVTIAKQTPLKINNLASFHITGTCDYTVKLPSHSVPQRRIPFEVYLQRQSEGKTWRIAFPQVTEAGDIIWTTQRIPTAVYK
jgi:hypothetical protein